MPELPEVETTIKVLRSSWVDKVIKDLVIQPRGARHFDISPTEVQDKLIGAKLAEISRIGKWIKLTFQKDNLLIPAVSHLRMSGRFFNHAGDFTSSHESFRFSLDDGSHISYIDQRRFGTFHLVNDFAHYPSLQNLGPDALTDSFNAEYLTTKLQKVSKSIYAALLDQSIVAGLGNIYVNESLHAAGIHPLQAANSLTRKQVEKLVREVRRILALALALKGTTLLDALYSPPDGTGGEFYKLLQVYGRKKDPDIEVLKIGGRSVFVHRSTYLHSYSTGK